MNVIKRSGEEVLFAADKIKVAVTKANSATNPENQMPSSTIDTIVNAVVDKCKALNRSVGL